MKSHGILNNGKWFCSEKCCQNFEKSHPKTANVGKENEKSEKKEENVVKIKEEKEEKPLEDEKMREKNSADIEKETDDLLALES